MNQMNFKCDVCGHRAQSIFCSLAGSHLAKLDQEKIVHNYEKGQIIFYEGNPTYGIHCLYSGRVKLYKKGPKDEEVIIRILGPGEIMGYRALLANEPCAATAEALEPSIICSISKQTFLELLRMSPDLALRLLSKMAKELRISEEQTLSLAQESVRQRTVHLLLFLLEGNAKKVKPDEPIKLQLMRKDMAQMIGTTPESLSRTLNYLAKRGILRLTHSGIYVHDLSALKRLVPDSSSI